MDFYKVIIIGGGAGGIIAAIESGKRFSGKEVLLLEKADRIGKKLAATGNGRGNLSNADLTSEHYYGGKKVANFAIERFGNQELKNYFENLGVMLTEEDGKIYPMSFQATSVLDMLMARLNSLGVEIKTSFGVTSIEKIDGMFYCRTDKNETFKAENVIIAAGGSSGGHFSTDGGAYKLASAFGHTVTKTYPSLVQLKCNMKDYGNLRGIKVNAKVTAVASGRVMGSAVGDLLFTEYGVSGNTIFSVSSKLVKDSLPQLKIDFLPEIELADLVSFLERKRKNCPYLEDSDLLTGVVNKQVGKVIMKRFPHGNANGIAAALKEFIMPVTGNTGFMNSQVTKGGIRTEEVDINTFESKLVSGLYVIGEILDVDGDCGGYNLHFAFASGYISANSLK